MAPAIGPLRDAADAWREGRHDRNAVMVPECTAWLEDCAMLHLFQADSCFRLASGLAEQAAGLRALDAEDERLPAMRDDARGYYACAARGFAEALNRPDQWYAVDGIRFETQDAHLRLVESLAATRDLSEGLAVATWNAQALQWSEAYQEAFREDPRADTFLVEAMLRTIELDGPLRLDKPALCRELDRVARVLDAAIRRPPGPTDRMLALAERLRRWRAETPGCLEPEPEPMEDAPGAPGRIADPGSIG